MKNKTVTFNADVKKVIKCIPLQGDKKPSYKIYVEEDDINDEISASIHIDGKRLFYFECMIEVFPYCCGVYELGEINTSSISDFKDYVDMDKYIKEVFNRLFADIFKNREMFGKTLVINTVPTVNCIELEKYLSTSKYFTQVKQWKNSGNGNLVTMWISNNM